MNRKDLLNELKHLTPYDASEADSILKTIAFIETEPDAFHRHLAKGHVVGSALLMGPDDEVLLMFHKGLQKWLQFGGHADGSENILEVAMRETDEESLIDGLELTLLSDGIADVDVHWIPDRPEKNEAAHWHYDIRYIFRANKKDFRLGDSGVEKMQWLTLDNAEKIATDLNMLRVLKKARALKPVY